MKTVKEMRKRLIQDNKRRPDILTMMDQTKWPEKWRLENMIEVWVSKRFLVQVFNENEGSLRVSVCRTQIDDADAWMTNISWDDLMQIKRDIGRAQLCALEVLPADFDIVNVANMRHFWILKDPFFGWRNDKPVVLAGYSEGDACNRDGCIGVLHYGPVDNCLCHISPPCSECVTNPLSCPECSWQSE